MVMKAELRTKTCQFCNKAVGEPDELDPSQSMAWNKPGTAGVRRAARPCGTVLAPATRRGASPRAPTRAGLSGAQSLPGAAGRPPAWAPANLVAAARRCRTSAGSPHQSTRPAAGPLAHAPQPDAPGPLGAASGGAARCCGPHLRVLRPGEDETLPHNDHEQPPDTGPGSPAGRPPAPRPQPSSRGARSRRAVPTGAPSGGA